MEHSLCVLHTGQNFAVNSPAMPPFRNELLAIRQFLSGVPREIQRPRGGQRAAVSRGGARRIAERLRHCRPCRMASRPADHVVAQLLRDSCQGAIRPAVTASKKSIAAAVDATAEVLAKFTGFPSHAIPDGDARGRLRPQWWLTSPPPRYRTPDHNF